MPIHDLGYRKLESRGHFNPMSWWVIASGGMQVAWRNFWLRRLLLLAWMPALTLGFCFFAFEQYKTRASELYQQRADNPLAGGLVEWVLSENSNNGREDTQKFFSESERVVERIKELKAALDNELPEEEIEIVWSNLRHDVWALLLLTFFRYPQGILMVLVIGLIAPQLISTDVRTRAFLLYFSRPITQQEYILGKSVVVWCYLMLITTLPALMLYLVGVMLSPDLSVVYDTWDLPLRILAASAFLLIPTTMLALMFSSLTAESRFAGYAWFTAWALGWVAHIMLSASLTFGQSSTESATPTTEQPQSQQTMEGKDKEDAYQWTHVSLIHVLWNVQGWVFGLEDWRSAWGSVLVLVALTVFSMVVVVRRVSAPLRV